MADPEYHFRFKNKRPQTLPGMLRLDDAIDRLGRIVYGQKWGGPGSEILPAFFAKARTEVITVGGKPTSKHDIRQRHPCRDLSKQQITKVEELDALYREVRSAVRQNHLRFVFLNGKGNYVRVRRTLLFSQRTRIFGTGVVRVVGQHFRVYARRREFESWLETKKHRKQLSSIDALALVNKLEEYGTTHSYRFAAAHIVHLINGARPELLISESYVRDNVLARLSCPSIGGRPKSGTVSKMISDLLPEVAALLSRV